MSPENAPPVNDTNTSRIEVLERSLAIIADQLKQTTQRMDRLEQTTRLILEAAIKSAESEKSRLVRDGFANASKIYPKDRTVVFCGRENFADNTKYAYLAFLDYAKKNGIECSYMTYDERQYQQLTAANIPCLPTKPSTWSAKEANLLLRTKVLVLSNVFYPVEGEDYLQYALTRGAKVVQLWHGIPIKRTGFEDLRAPGLYMPRNAEVLGASGPFDVLVAGSKATKEDWARCFSFKEYAPIGYARMDALFREPTEKDLINVDVATLNAAIAAKQNGRPFILYVPTFRDRNPGAWFGKSSIDVFAKHCIDKGYEFYVNLHPFEQELNERLKTLYPHIKCIARSTDIYPLLRHVDIAITDYSSTVLDFLPMDKPIVFFTPDHNEYTSESRGLVNNYEEYMTGERVADAASLIKAVDAAVDYSKNPSADIYAAKRNALRQKLFDYNDGLASNRLAELIGRMVDEP